MDDHEKSYEPVGPAIPRNKAGVPAADGVEERGSTKEISLEPASRRTLSRGSVDGLERVRQAARRDGKARFTALLHHVDLDRLRAAYVRLNPKAAAGIDGVVWADYGKDLEANLRDLHGRLHRGAYRPKPARRVYIAKADGRQRPLGVVVLEDKIVQGAVAEVLNAVYEQDFVGFSYGFRPGRSPHDALDALDVAITRGRVNWVLDADIRDFFSTISHEWLVVFVEHRIADRRIVRLVQRWLAAGVLEDGEWRREEAGTPQGATISPLLANLYLHHVFDLWARHWRRHVARGAVYLVRYGDDFVAGFQRGEDAERFRADLEARFVRFGLELHADKTRLIEFGRFAAENRRSRGLGKPETFSFLGFTHVCGTAKSGKFLLRRHTDRRRLRGKLSEVKGELRRRMHTSIDEQGAWLRRVVQGHFNYYAVPTNSRALSAFRHHVKHLWMRTLRRRSQKQCLTWARMSRLERRWLPPARILHPWPSARLRVYPR